MKRRLFIKNSALTALLPYFLGTFTACNTRPNRKNPVFILIQLIGGNDGLNTVIPLGEYANLSQARPTLLIPESKVLSLKGFSGTGLHPAMPGLQDLFNNNLASIVQGVGYENPSYSHFRSSDIMLTGSGPNETWYTGWMARYLDLSFKNYPKGFPNATHPDPPGIKIGDTGSFLFEGSNMDLSIVIDPYKSYAYPEVFPASSTLTSYAAEEVKSIREILLQTKSYSSVVTKALQNSFTHSKLYPESGENSLADQLKVVAKMIHSGLQTSVYLVDLKGFDMHDDQADLSDPTKGVHAGLLKKVSEAITCFWDDIQTMGRENDVAGLVFSEFGRRIRSNASNGTDHGSSQPFIFFGADLNTGITGANPHIPDKVLATDNLNIQHNFRSVYQAILKQWIGVPAAEVKEILKGDFPEVQIFK